MPAMPLCLLVLKNPLFALRKPQPNFSLTTTTIITNTERIEYTIKMINVLFPPNLHNFWYAIEVLFISEVPKIKFMSMRVHCVCVSKRKKTKLNMNMPSDGGIKLNFLVKIKIKINIKSSLFVS